MIMVHLECKPDELLVMALGISRKQITHHSGKSRVYGALQKNSNAIGLVDEDPDPGSPKYTYENDLMLIEEKFGVKRFADKKRSNTVLVLKIKLEDWLISAGKVSGIDITKQPYNLPGHGNDLHKVINDRFPVYQKLLDDLLAKNNKPLLTLKEWLKQKGSNAGD